MLFCSNIKDTHVMASSAVQSSLLHTKPFIFYINYHHRNYLSIINHKTTTITKFIPARCNSSDKQTMITILQTISLRFKTHLINKFLQIHSPIIILFYQILHRHINLREITNHNFIFWIPTHQLLVQ